MIIILASDIFVQINKLIVLQDRFKSAKFPPISSFLHINSREVGYFFRNQISGAMLSEEALLRPCNRGQSGHCLQANAGKQPSSNWKGQDRKESKDHRSSCSNRIPRQEMIILTPSPKRGFLSALRPLMNKTQYDNLWTKVVTINHSSCPQEDIIRLLSAAENLIFFIFHRLMASSSLFRGIYRFFLFAIKMFVANC